MKRPLISFVVFASLAVVAAIAATPPATVNYQGVLRNASDAPQTGSYDMVFRFFDLASLGNEILVDSHTAGGANAVSVSGGLFDVQLGGGTITDGSGPGTYTSLADVFRDYGAVYLEIQIGAETLAPRTRVNSAAYALNATNLNGRAASGYLDTSPTAQTKTGQATFDSTGAASGYGVQALGPDAGLYAKDSNGAGYGYVGSGDWGVLGFGLFPGGAGGYFKDTGHTGEAQVAAGDSGIVGYGTYAGGIFRNGTPAAYTDESYLGFGGYGVQGIGGTAGGYFQDRNDSGYAYVGSGPYGIQAYGTVQGGYFSKIGDVSTHAGIASNGRGVDASGSVYGVYGTGSYGVRGDGTDTGVWGNGTNTGGYFDSAPPNWGYAYVGRYDTGILAEGRYGGSACDAGGESCEAGGRFRQSGGYTGKAMLAIGDTGVLGYGNYAGAIFRHGSPSAYDHEVLLATGSNTVFGPGTKNFVQNHPYEKDELIVYASLEGDEVGTYTRGSARLDHGVARVTLGDTFQWVTNPDIGLTAQLTPHGSPVPLAVESLSTGELVVRAPEGTPDVQFDYAVHGLRIGFERAAVVKLKDREEPIPPMTDHLDLYAVRPDLERFNALERFKTMRKPAETGAGVDLTRAAELRSAIGFVDPEHPPRLGGSVLTPQHEAELAATHAGQARDPAVHPIEASAELPNGVSGSQRAPGNVVEASSAPDRRSGSLSTERFLHQASASALNLVHVAEPVEAGDVLVVDRERPGTMRLGSVPADPALVGIVAVADPNARLEPGEAPVALAGAIVSCKVDASFGAIRLGDLLTVSPTPGHAMRSGDPVPGTIVGKALEALDTGAGLIKVLVMSR
jgi:hypothetical protein